MAAEVREGALVSPSAATGQKASTPWYVDSGIMAPANLGTGAKSGTSAGRVPIQANQVRGTRLCHIIVPGQRVVQLRSRVGSIESQSGLESPGGHKWSSSDFIEAHRLVKLSGMFNFQYCRIPVPTKIRYDRLQSSLGQVLSFKEKRTLDLLQFGMPLDCDPNFGVRKVQKNHSSATNFASDIGHYFHDNLESQAILGPFNIPPIPELCFSPLMSVPKDENSRRVIVDFSFPPGKSVNDGICKSAYLDFEVEFSLPSVNSMVGRLNALGPGCLLYKRDLKSAFRQFSIDPGDYGFTGLAWEDKFYLDTRLAMGLRSAAFCCQAVTEMVAKIFNRRFHVLVYLDDFGGAELPESAYEAFNSLGKSLEFFGLEESPSKAVPPTTSMDWLGSCFDTVQWTMAIKPSKLQQLLDMLPMVLGRSRVRKKTLQKVLGNLVWASTVLRAGRIFFNRLLMLLRKIKRPSHSIYFSREAKKDILWWIHALRAGQGKCAIPPSVWTPLLDFSTDASLQGFGMVWGSRAIAGIFTLEFEDLDINAKELLAVMSGIKHWFAELANTRVRIFTDNQVCVSLLNSGFTRSPFLNKCLREIQFYLASYNIEIKAEYVASKENVFADVCSRAFSSEVHFNNFNKLLSERILILDFLLYQTFEFDCDW